MGRYRSSATRRFLNPTEVERKQQRLKEIKRNKRLKEDAHLRQVRGRDPDELIQQLECLDDNELSGVIRISTAERRRKLRASFTEIIDLHRGEGNEDKVQELENKLISYDSSRIRKIQAHAAVKFAQSGDLSIPLPEGDWSTANLLGFRHSGTLEEIKSILKKPRRKRPPPGPPIGIPPEFSDEDHESPITKHVRFIGLDEMAYENEDLAPVPVPAALCLPMPTPLGIPFPPLLNPLSLPKPFSLSSGRLEGLGTTPDTRPATISAVPEINQDISSATISAAPMVRDLFKAATSFTPTPVLLKRKNFSNNVPISSRVLTGEPCARKKKARKAVDTDLAYEQFIAEIKALEQ